MNSQTARRPNNLRAMRSAKAKRYTKQTAHVEARRDGKPLVFGWGSHLSHYEKIQLQRRLVWATTVLIALVLVAVIVGFWVNINVIVPGLPITTVNGQAIPQSDYRKLLAVKAQLLYNSLHGPHGLYAQRDALKKQVGDQQKSIDNSNNQISDLSKKIAALPASADAQRADLNKQLSDTKAALAAAQSRYDQANAQYNDVVNNTIPQQEQLYNQSQQGNETADWLQQDVFIRQWLPKQSAAVQAKVEPSQSAINRAVKDFSTSLPTSTPYDKFLSTDNVSDADVHAMLALKLRRESMQTYLAGQIVSPTYQVLPRAITVASQSDAAKLLAQLKSGADFAKLAKEKSTDVNTNTKGGELGWLARGQYAQNIASGSSAVVDNWLFDPARKPDELSPVLSENGAFHILQVEKIDPARSVDATTLKSLRDTALSSWILSQKALPGVKVTAVDQDKLLDALNIPPGLPLSAPGQNSPSGLPGDTSGGIPAGGAAPAGGIPAGGAAPAGGIQPSQP